MHWRESRDTSSRSPHPDRRMHLFTCTEFEGKIKDCDEGELVWIKKKEIYQLNLWEGDRIFLEKLSTDSPFFQLRLIYCGDRLESWSFLDV